MSQAMLRGSSLRAAPFSARPAKASSAGSRARTVDVQANKRVQKRTKVAGLEFVANWEEARCSHGDVWGRAAGAVTTKMGATNMLACMRPACLLSVHVWCDACLLQIILTKDYEGLGEVRLLALSACTATAG